MGNYHNSPEQRNQSVWNDGNIESLVFNDLESNNSDVHKFKPSLMSERIEIYLIFAVYS